MFPNLPTPALLVERRRLEANLATMQNRCDAAGVELRPHIKTHKCIEIARRQLELGAKGLTCAKLSEAEAMLPAFEGQSHRDVFLAHSLVDPALAPRLQCLREQLESLVLAVTSINHANALNALLARVRGSWPVMMALDSGLGREGARGVGSALELAMHIEALPHLQLNGIYTHEGHFYGGLIQEALHSWHERLMECVTAVERTLGYPIKVWPGCSANADAVAQLPGIDAIRPGAYVFGDMFLTCMTGAMTPEHVALHVLATVIDLPEPGLALLDCGSKTLSSDRTPNGLYASSRWGDVYRVSEEHGFLHSEQLSELSVGQRVRLTPAHVCPVVNLADELQVVEGGSWLGSWRVAARGKVH